MDWMHRHTPPARWRWQLGDLILSRVSYRALVVLILSIGLGGGAWAGSSDGLVTFVEAHFDVSQPGGAIDGLEQAQGVVVSPDGRHVYVVTENDDSLLAFSRDRATGEVGFVEAEFDGTGIVDGLDGARGVAISPDGGHVYVVSVVDDALAVFSRDSTTGDITADDVDALAVFDVQRLLFFLSDASDATPGGPGTAE